MDSASVIANVLLVYLAAVLSPGPNFAVVSRLSLTGSRIDGLAASLGIAVASTFYAVATLLGLAALLQTAPWLNVAMRILGAGFLIYLGMSACAKPASTRSEVLISASPLPRGLLANLRTGLLVAFCNPKAIAFFGGLYSAIIPLGTPLWAKGTILAGSFLIEIAWYAAVAVLFSSLSASASYERHQPWLERAFGVLLLAIGLRFVLMLFEPGSS